MNCLVIYNENETDKGELHGLNCFVFATRSLFSL